MVLRVESFEDVVAGANSPVLFGGFLQVGITGPYQFASGLRLISPIPNTVFPEVVVGDFAVGPAGGLFGSETLAEGDIPDGTAFIRHNSGGMSFDFGGAAAYVVGAYVDSAGTLPILSAYDASGNLISGLVGNSVPIGDWDSNYVQITSRVPIAKFSISGNQLVVDQVSFDTAKPKIIDGGKGNDKLKGSAALGDYIYGKGGKDKIDGKGGNDTLEGGKGIDKVKGGDGDDTLIAASGDSLQGDAGYDNFLFRMIDGVAKLKDFNPFFDTILLAQTTFFGLDKGNPSAEQLALGAAAAEPDDRLVYDPATGNLGYDGDGTGPGALRLFAKLPAGLGMSATDFLVL